MRFARLEHFKTPTVSTSVLQCCRITELNNLCSDFHLFCKHHLMYMVELHTEGKHGLSQLWITFVSLEFFGLNEWDAKCCAHHSNYKDFVKWQNWSYGSEKGKWFDNQIYATRPKLCQINWHIMYNPSLLCKTADMHNYRQYSMSRFSQRVRL